jgi:hypothetical protein
MWQPSWISAFPLILYPELTKMAEKYEKHIFSETTLLIEYTLYINHY